MPHTLPPARPTPGPSARAGALRATIALAATLGATLGAACASSRATRPSDQVSVTPQTVQIQTGDATTINLNMINEDRADSRIIKAPLDQVWKMLPAVYAELSLPVNLFVDRTHQIGAKSARFRGRVGKTRLSQYVSCGSDITGEDKANTYEITLDVMSAIGPLDGGQTNLLTMVTASGRPLATSGEAVRCTSTGALERTLAQVVTLRTATAK
jgi:hypothetical protein